MTDCRGDAKWFKREGVYNMIFKVPALIEEIGDPLEIYIVLTVIIRPCSHFFKKGGKKIILLLWGGRILSWI